MRQGGKEGAKGEPDRQVEECNLFVLYDLNDQGGIWGNPNCCG